MHKHFSRLTVEERTDSGDIFELEATGGGQSLNVWFERQGRVKGYSEAADFRMMENLTVTSLVTPHYMDQKTFSLLNILGVNIGGAGSYIYRKPSEDKPTSPTTEVAPKVEERKISPAPKTLNKAEKVTSLGKDWHRPCLRCERCSKTLTPGGHAELRYPFVSCFVSILGLVRASAARWAALLSQALLRNPFWTKGLQPVSPLPWIGCSTYVKLFMFRDWWGYTGLKAEPRCQSSRILTLFIIYNLLGIMKAGHSVGLNKVLEGNGKSYISTSGKFIT
ncbi:unnamed protein product [Ranitomeya imitator]|uniref:LIM zinc-binding domain-containing protein n=1 Tax=Ranitomeya imitator TaxID=111125 RepID=A0ABN9LH43_9NEOB|nr:unnamed protein product [Ranitomeya imitator]